MSEFFGWGKYGGFGSMARTLAHALTQKGVEVFAVVPRREGQKPREELDGITVLSYPGQRVLSTDSYAFCDSDVYHSMEATIASFAAMRAMPHRKHIITSIDPFDWSDWKVEFRYDVREKWPRGLLYPFMWGYYGGPWVHRAVRQADQVYCQAKFLIPKVRRLYNLSSDPVFMPNPYAVPEGTIRKSDKPTACFLARWDPRKRPEVFFELARQVPSVRFIALGKAHDEARDRRLRDQFGGLPNLELVGFINPFESDRIERILQESWIVVNTAAREGLPAAFVEAAAHKCAILSCLDPDNFTTRGGCLVKDEDFAEGLRYLLEDNRWRKLGERGYAYVKSVHDTVPVVNQHLDEYKRLLAGRSEESV
jgi:glycosyltransferase involved in cell wall biosynthesis